MTEPAKQVLWPDDQVLLDLATVARHAPLIHCLTNTVAANFTANALLAVGASPAMVEHETEAQELATVAGALLVNVGTVSESTAAAMIAATVAAQGAGTPWVLDPVAVGVLGFRGLLARELLTSAPTVVRGNASEVLSLAGAAGGGRGVDSTVDSAGVIAPAREFARRRGNVVAVSGVVDYITDGDTVIAVPGGDPMMSQVTGVGCVLGALISAFLAVNPEPLTAAASASAVLAAAGERAARGVPGPGTFAVRLIDELHVLTQTAKEAAA